MWNFIANEKVKVINKIEFIFDYISKKRKNTDYLFTFETISEMIDKDEINVEEFWDETKKCFRILKEWHSDIELYNFIGFLNMYNNLQTYKLMEEYSKANEKNEFRMYLRKCVLEELNKVIEDIDAIDSLTYNDNSDKIKKILILFNILTMNKLNLKFPFEKFSKGEWSIEHIHPKNCIKFEKKEQWETWCIDEENTIQELMREFETKDSKKYTQFSNALEKIKFIQNNIDNRELREKNFMEISDLMEEENSNYSVHSIGNLALLDKDTNSKIGNNFFNTKRKKLIKMELEGEYIPICTKNVFLKFYSNNPNQVFLWTNKDRNEYKSVIKNILMEIEEENFLNE